MKFAIKKFKFNNTANRILQIFEGHCPQALRRAVYARSQLLQKKSNLFFFHRNKNKILESKIQK